ncbi:hypothetical protein KR093_000484, partial [Drosophila rubida]
MCRRCVVCGTYVASNSSVPYHYPKNKHEALIWKRSMGATDTCVNTIQKQCCVCIKHIPQFVELAQKQAALMMGKCQCAKDSNSRQSLSVLLLPGATLMPNCANAPETNGAPTDDLDGEEIVVNEFNVSDRGAIFPDLDETEVTVLRTPAENEENRKQRQDNAKEQCGDAANTSDCTDVLLLSRSRSDEQCDCDKEGQEDAAADTALCTEFNSNMERQPQQLPGCECERRVRYELGEVIKRQQERIYELEYQLCRQSDWQFTMHQKLNELYTEFGRME